MLDAGQHLMMLGIPSPTGLSRWSKGTIVNILKNSANIGTLEYFKTSSTTVADLTGGVCNGIGGLWLGGAVSTTTRTG